MVDVNEMNGPASDFWLNMDLEYIPNSGKKGSSFVAHRNALVYIFFRLSVGAGNKRFFPWLIGLKISKLIIRKLKLGML